MQFLLMAVFAVGYLLIIFEKRLKINKAAPALLAGVLCWVILAVSPGDSAHLKDALAGHVSDISNILFFLLGAITIVELIDAHRGFDIITNRILIQDRCLLLWAIGIIAFFLSAILDNLTTTIVMIMFVRKLVKLPEERFLFAGIIVIAANAGGAWSPIGDVTTTMLWIEHRITSLALMKRIFLPSLVNLLVPLTVTTLTMGKSGKLAADVIPAAESKADGIEKTAVFTAGVAVLVLVPVFKGLTGLPPFMGMLLGLGVIWLLTEVLHRQKEEEHRNRLSIYSALKRMDMSSILFFLGILLAVAALETSGLLGALASAVGNRIGSEKVIATLIGIASAVIDNVPLVAASIGMYPLPVYPTDHAFWELLAYTSGTGGSILIIGSAAGIAAMGLEKVEFFRYLRRFSWIALLGYFCGIGVYVLECATIFR
jgi:Na+/H+ antiporter NhaD/arsenite permease-like protein